MIVKPNSEVKLFGSLTNSNCRPYWQGVEIWGNKNLSQYPEGSKYHQGRFIGYHGAIIENALTGFKLYGPDRNDSGGQIYLTGVTLRNNQTGVDIPPYENYYPYFFPPSSHGQVRNYISGFNKCSFINDEYFPHDGFKSFVNLIGIHGISLRGCSFINNYIPATASQFYDIGFGVASDNSTFFIQSACEHPIQSPEVPCENVVSTYFSGLGVGVAARSNVFFDRFYPYVLSEATFENCFIGVQNRAISGFTLLNNNFYLGEVPDPQITDVQLGVELSFQIDGFEIQENNFSKTSTQGNLSLVGMRFDQIGRFNNVIRRNFFDGLDVHSEILGDNGGISNPWSQGLNFNCNFNSQSTLYDYFVCEGGSVRPDQGLPDLNAPDDFYDAAGNRFSRTGSPSERDFSNHGEDINYHYYPMGVNEEPIDYSSMTIDLFETRINHCQPKFCLPPCRTPAEIDVLKTLFFSDQQLLGQTKMAYEASINAQQDSLIKKYLQKGSAIKSRMDQTAYRVLQHEILDTINYSQDSVWAWMYRMGTYPMILSLARQKEENGLYQESDQLMQEIFSMASEENLISLDLALNDSLDHLLANDWDSLSASELNYLKNIVEYSTPVASARAAAPLDHRGISWQTACNYSGQSQLISNSDESFGNFPGILAYPNPATDHVVFEIDNPSGVEPISVTIFDAMGGNVHHHRWKEGADGYRWDASSFASGIYFYRFQFIEGSEISGKIVLLR